MVVVILRNIKIGEYKHRKFGSAINKYGWNNFEHILLEETSDPMMADTLERFYIDKYDSLNNGYNCTTGGSLKKELSAETRERLSKSHLRENLSEDIIQKYRDCKIGNSFTKGKHYKSISDSKKGNKNPMYKKEPWNKYLERSLEAFDPESGKTYYFKSPREAAEYFGIRTSSNINRCCNGHRDSCAGLLWKWTDESKVSDKVIKTAAENLKKKFRPVIGISIKDNSEVEFESVAQAAKFCNLKSTSSIINQIRGTSRSKSAGGYIWKYKN